jgi:predicted DNA-binding ribbon-helix-helix protein
MALLQKRSLTLSGHETSIALEGEFWSVLQAIAAERRVSLAALVREVDEGRGPNPLASACRLAALRWALARRAESS